MKRFSYIAFLITASLTLHATVAAAATLTLTSAGNVVSNGVYIGPYTVKVDNTSTLKVICDDFNSETYLLESWVANPLSLEQAVTSGRFSSRSNALDGYAIIGWLANQLMANVGTSAVPDIQFALWRVFGTAVPVTTGSTAWLANAQNWLTQTKASGVNPLSLLSNVLVFAPVSCLSGCQTWPPQEFITITTPEPATLSLLGFGAAALAAARRRRQRAAARRA